MTKLIELATAQLKLRPFKTPEAEFFSSRLKPAQE
jgi:hypothetical protein